MIGRKAILAFAVSFFKNAIGYVAIYIVVRKMGPEAFGTLCFGFAYVGLFNVIADMGIGSAHIKKLTEGLNSAVCMGTYMAIRLVTTAVMAAIVLLSILVYHLIFGKPVQSPEHERVIYLALLTFVFVNIGAVPGHTFTARKETAKQVIPELFGKTIETGLKIGVAVLGLGVVMLAGASVVGAVVSLLIYAILCRGVSFGRPSLEMGKSYALFALPILGIQIASAVTDNFDQILIQFFWGSEELGFYGGGAKITTILSWAGVALGMLIFPTVSAFHGNRDFEGIRRVTHRAERFAALFLIPLACLIMFFNAQLVRLLLGGQFTRANQIVMTLVWSSVIAVLTAPYAAQIIGTGRVRLYGILGFVSILFCVGLNLVLIPREFHGIPLAGLGAFGAALASVITTSVMALLYRLAAYRATATGYNPSMIRHGMAAGAMLLDMMLIRRLAGEGLLAGLGCAASGLLVYAGVLAAAGEALWEDILYLLRAVSPGRMGVYIRDELRTTPSLAEEES